MKKTLLVGLILLISLGLFYKVSTSDQSVVSPKDFGEGVYYFSIIDGSRSIFGSLPRSRDPEIFGRSLAAFKAANPNLKVTGIASKNFDVGDFNFTAGYWVNFEEK